MGDKLSFTFMSLFCEKNSDGTKTLRMKGKDIFQRTNDHIRSKDMILISHFLLQNPTIVELDLCYNKIRDKGVRILMQYFFCETDVPLKHLNLAMCDITEVGIEHMYNYKGQFKLRSLRLNGNKIGTEGGKKLALIAGDMETLWHLDVGETDQTLSSIPYYLKILNRNFYNSTIRIIDLSRVIPLFNRFPYDSGHFAESVGVMLEQNESLIEIHLQKNQFDGHDVELLLYGLRRNKTLLMLDLGYNKMSDTGLEKICCWLNTRPQLVGLNVAGNSITDIGARYMSLTMPNSHIRLLDLCSNKLTPTGILDILYSIKKPYQMRMLTLWGNTFSHETNKVIKRMLAAKVFSQQCIDVKIYEVDNVLYAAYYRSDRYKHKYYSVMDYACPVEIKIKRNYLPNYMDEPRRLVNFQFYPRLPFIKIPFGKPFFTCKEKEKVEGEEDEDDDEDENIKP